MNIVRKYKLHRLGIKQESNYANLFEFLDSKFEKFVMIKDIDISSYIYFLIDGVSMLEYHEMNNHLFANWKFLWKDLEIFGFGYNNLVLIFKEIMSKTYGLEIEDISSYQTYDIIMEKNYQDYLNISKEFHKY